MEGQKRKIIDDSDTDEDIGQTYQQDEKQQNQMNYDNNEETIVDHQTFDSDWAKIFEKIRQQLQNVEGAEQIISSVIQTTIRQNLITRVPDFQREQPIFRILFGQEDVDDNLQNQITIQYASGIMSEIYTTDIFTYCSSLFNCIMDDIVIYEQGQISEQQQKINNKFEKLKQLYYRCTIVKPDYDLKLDYKFEDIQLTQAKQQQKQKRYQELYNAVSDCILRSICALIRCGQEFSEFMQYFIDYAWENSDEKINEMTEECIEEKIQEIQQHCKDENVPIEEIINDIVQAIKKQKEINQKMNKQQQEKTEFDKEQEKQYEQFANQNNEQKQQQQQQQKKQ